MAIYTPWLTFLGISSPGLESQIMTYWWIQLIEDKGISPFLSVSWKRLIWRRTYQWGLDQLQFFVSLTKLFWRGDSWALARENTTGILEQSSQLYQLLMNHIVNRHFARNALKFTLGDDENVRDTKVSLVTLALQKIDLVVEPG